MVDEQLWITNATPARPKDPEWSSVTPENPLQRSTAELGNDAGTEHCDFRLVRLLQSNVFCFPVQFCVGKAAVYVQLNT